MSGGAEDDMIKSAFGGMRSLFVKGESKADGDKPLLNELKNRIATQSDFVLGAFVVWERPEDEVPKGVVLDSEVLFFGSEANGEFKDKARKTLKDIEGKQLFVSSLLHRNNSPRSRQIDLIHNCEDCGALAGKSCEGAGAGGEAWYSVNKLSDLPRVFDVAKDKENATQYVEVVKGYFKSSDGAYVIVYCPFLVPDGKPPGNYFGVYKCNGDPEALLNHLEAVQHAGTLIFARRAIANALSSEAARLKGPLKTLRDLRTEMGLVSGAIGQIEAIVNPYYMFVANTEIQGFAKALKDVFLDISPTDKCHEVRDWTNNEECWKRLERAIQSRLPTISNIFTASNNSNTYSEYFSPFESTGSLSTNNDAKLKTACIAKALNYKYSPLHWIDTSLQNTSTTLVNVATAEKTCAPCVMLGGNVPPLPFNLALRSLKSDPSNDISASICDDTLSITIKINKKDDGSLDILDSEINEKVKMDIESFSDGGTVSACALLRKACSFVKQVVDDDKSTLTLSLQYTLREVS